MKDTIFNKSIIFYAKSFILNIVIMTLIDFLSINYDLVYFPVNSFKNIIIIQIFIIYVFTLVQCAEFTHILKEEV